VSVPSSRVIQCPISGYHKCPIIYVIHSPWREGLERVPTDHTCRTISVHVIHHYLFGKVFQYYFPLKGRPQGVPYNSVIHYWKKSPVGITVLVVHSITNKTGKSFCPTMIDYGSHYVRPFRVIHDPCLTRLLRIVIWILKIPLGILSYTLRIIQVLHLTCSPEGVRRTPYNEHTGTKQKRTKL
jgi:hypothetical protein